MVEAGAASSRTVDIDVEPSMAVPAPMVKMLKQRARVLRRKPQAAHRAVGRQPAGRWWPRWCRFTRAAGPSITAGTWIGSGWCWPGDRDRLAHAVAPLLRRSTTRCFAAGGRRRRARSGPTTVRQASDARPGAIVGDRRDPRANVAVLRASGVLAGAAATGAAGAPRPWSSWRASRSSFSPRSFRTAVSTRSATPPTTARRCWSSAAPSPPGRRPTPRCTHPPHPHRQPRPPPGQGPPAGHPGRDRRGRDPAAGQGRRATAAVTPLRSPSSIRSGTACSPTPKAAPSSSASPVVKSPGDLHHHTTTDTTSDTETVGHATPTGG